MVLAGGSGTGKTFRLRDMLAQINAQAGHQVRVHVIDPHGDVNIPGAHTTKFSESTQFGLNPLKISPDLDYGGVRKCTGAFITMLLRNTTLGDRQRSALTRAIYEMYWSYGFAVEDPRTWDLAFDPRDWAKTPKRHPTVGDLKRHLMKRLRTMKFGMGGSASKAFDDLCREQKKVTRLRLQQAKGAEIEDKLEQAKSRAIDAYIAGVNALDTGDELQELIDWDSVETVKALYDRIESLEASGIFKGEAPRFDDHATIWRYDIKALSRDEQQMFCDCLLSEIFFDCKMQGESPDPHTFVVIDEASIFVDPEPDHIINIILREARKFGLGLWLASQSITHFPESILSSAAVKMILGVDEMYHAKTERALGLAPGKLRFIKPRQTALVQVKAAGDLTNRFYETTLAGLDARRGAA